MESMADKVVEILTSRYAFQFPVSQVYWVCCQLRGFYFGFPRFPHLLDILDNNDQNSQSKHEQLLQGASENSKWKKKK